MKARIKATGEIVEISTFQDNNKFPTTYDENELEFLVSNDYRTRLEHQAAIAAMQGLLSNHAFFKDVDRVTNGKPEDMVTTIANSFAHALVEKMKEERK